MRLFTRQLQWACQQCKRLQKHEGEEKEEAQTMDQRSIQAVRIQIRATEGAEETFGGRSIGARQPGESYSAVEEQVDDAKVENMETCTTSTTTADDYAHRGAHLHTMPFPVYRMYARRVLNISKT